MEGNPKKNKAARRARMAKKHGDELKQQREATARLKPCIHCMKGNEKVFQHKMKEIDAAYEEEKRKCVEERNQKVGKLREESLALNVPSSAECVEHNLSKK